MSSFRLSDLNFNTILSWLFLGVAVFLLVFPGLDLTNMERFLSAGFHVCLSLILITRSELEELREHVKEKIE